MRLGDGRITLEEQENWQKVVMPAEKKPPLFILYTILMLIWLIMFGFMVVGLFSPFGGEAAPIFQFVWRALLVLWLGIWIWFARKWLWRYWQYYAANRELLFINPETFIIRRPVSILGVTDAYDMKHITPLAYDGQEKAVGFDYGSHPIRFGRGLTAREAGDLIAILNHRYFPQHDEE